MTVETMDIMGLDDIEQENTSMDDLNSENINLIFIAIDESGSMGGYIQDMKKNLSARANFHDSNIDIGGYKKIEEFDTAYNVYGMTPLYDVVVDGAEKLVNYMTYLKNQGMRVKAVFAIFSDGEDTSSRNSVSQAKNVITDLNSKEVTTAFISFGSNAMKEAKNMQFKNILQVGSSASELRKAFDCLSKSVIESSKSVVAQADDFFTM